MVERAQLVRHGVAHAQEGVGERHAGHGGGVGHLLAGLGVVGAVRVGAGQILENHLQALQGQAVGVVGGHHAGDGLQVVRHGVDAAGAGQPPGRVHHHVRVHDGHLGHELIVGQRVLDAGVLIGDDREGRDLAAGARRGGDGDEVRLFAHAGEGVGALADVAEAHGHVQEVRVRMLVEHPHDLGRVHGAAAADGDDAVGLEGGHGGRALLGGGQAGVGRHVKEGGVGDAHLVQAVGHGLGVAVMIEEAVGDDKDLLLAQHLFQLAQGHGQAALLDVHLFRRAEPQHVLSPLGDGLDVEQVLHANIFADGVAAPGAAAQREGGGQLEIVQIADAALGGGGVDHDAAGFHLLGEAHELFALGVGVEVDAGGMAVAAVLDEAFRLGHGVVKVLCAVHGQHGGELFVGKLLAEIDALDLADEHLVALVDVQTGQLCDLVRGLADDLGVEGAVDDDGLADLVQLLALKEIAPAGGELGAHLVIDAFGHDHALLGGADHAVVEGLGVDDGVDREQNVRALVDDGGHVARAHAQRRLAAGIGRAHHAGAAGGQGAVALAHDEVGHLQAGHVDPGDDVLRRAGRHRRLQHDARGLGRALPGARMRGDDDAVAGFQAGQRLENGRGGGVGGGNHGRDHAQRLGQAGDAVGLVLLDHAAGLDVAVGIVYIFGSKVVFDDLVLHHAHARLLDGHLGQRQAHLVCGHGRREEDAVHLFLRKLGILLLCGPHQGEFFLQAFHTVHGFACISHADPAPF